MTPRTSYLLPAVLAVSLAGCAQPGSSFSEADREAILAINDSAVAYITARNSAAWAALHTEDGMVMPPNHPAVQGHAALTAWMDSFPPITDVSFSEPVVEGSGDMAVLHSNVSMTVTPPGGAPVNDVAKQLVVFERQPDGAWRASYVSFNSDLPVPR